jgi:hypothetical protein
MAHLSRALWSFDIERWLRSPVNRTRLSRRGPRARAVAYWNVIKSVRLNVVAFGFKGWFARFALPEFKTL